MKTLGNICWLLLGGGPLALAWAAAGILCTVTVIGIPLGLQCFKFARYLLWPFGSRIVQNESMGSALLNFFWILLFGWELAAASLIIGFLWCLTVVGFPFGAICIRFCRLALFPFGGKVVSE